MQSFISIHALLAESDCAVSVQVGGDVNFYPRSPCGERHYFSAVMRQNPGISIHALLAASDLRVLDGSKSSIEISIHALLAESDCILTILICTVLKFLSTLSLRRATCLRCCAISCITISIHALLAESDRTQSQSLSA